MSSGFSLALLRGRTRLPLVADTPPLVEESEPLQIELALPPDTEATAWRLRLGDVVPDDALGSDLGPSIVWRRKSWFDCARGLVRLAVECNADPEASALGGAGWIEVTSASVLVHPSKVTEEQWLAMRADLEVVAADLANDLVGRASAGLGRPSRVRTPLDDLVAARRLVVRMRAAMEAIERQPHSVLRRAAERERATPRRLDGAALQRLLARGVDPRRRATEASGRIPTQRLVPSLDITEHRRIAATLRQATRRLNTGEARARAEVAEIEAERPWRERPGDAPGTTLYDRFDQPRIERLNVLREESAQLRRIAGRLLALPVLAGMQDDQRPLRASYVFRQIPAYRKAWRAMQAWQHGARAQVDVGDEIRRKDTDRMYEQWVFLQLAAGLRSLGLAALRHEDLFRRISARRFILDLPRGACMAFATPSGSLISLHFEPWIRPRHVAERLGDPFFHGAGRDAAWSPDVLLTITGGGDARPRGFVVDAKYARAVREDHWAGVRKYMQIQRVSDRGNPVTQVWIAAPGVEGVRINDGAVAWTVNGPDLPPGNSHVFGEVGLLPLHNRTPGDPIAEAKVFLRGLLVHAGVLAPGAGG